MLAGGFSGDLRAAFGSGFAFALRAAFTGVFFLLLFLRLIAAAGWGVAGAAAAAAGDCVGVGVVDGAVAAVAVGGVDEAGGSVGGRRGPYTGAVIVVAVTSPSCPVIDLLATLLFSSVVAAVVGVKSGGAPVVLPLIMGVESVCCRAAGTIAVATLS